MDHSSQTATTWIEHDSLDDDRLSPLICDSHDTCIGKQIKKLKFDSKSGLFELSNFINYDNSPGNQNKLLALNTTNEIADSLGADLYNSVSWSHEMETPHADIEKWNQRQGTSTLERVTLHPKLELKKSVLARALFSPVGGNKKGELNLTTSVMSPMAKTLDNKDFKSINNKTADFERCYTNYLEDNVSEFDTAFSAKMVNNSEEISPKPNRLNLPLSDLTSTPVTTKSFVKPKYAFGSSLDDAFSLYSMNGEPNSEIDDRSLLNNEDVRTNSISLTNKSSNINSTGLSCNVSNYKIDSKATNYKINSKSKISSNLSLKCKKSFKFTYPKSEDEKDCENESKLGAFKSPEICIRANAKLNKSISISSMDKHFSPNLVDNNFLIHTVQDGEDASLFIDKLSKFSTNENVRGIDHKSTEIDLDRLSPQMETLHDNNNSANDINICTAGKQSGASFSQSDSYSENFIAEIDKCKPITEYTIVTKSELFSCADKRMHSSDSLQMISCKMVKSLKVNRDYEECLPTREKVSDSVINIDKASFSKDPIKRDCSGPYCNNTFEKLTESIPLFYNEPEDKVHFGFNNKCRKYCKTDYVSPDTVLSEDRPKQSLNANNIQCKPSENVTLSTNLLPEKESKGPEFRLDKNGMYLQSKIFTGFQSCSGKKISVAKDSLKKVQEMWVEDNKSYECISSPLENITFSQGCGKKSIVIDTDSKQLKNLNSKIFTGFQSGSGKKIAIDGTSLKNVQTLYEECCKDEDKFDNFSMTSAAIEVDNTEKAKLSDKNLKHLQSSSLAFCKLNSSKKRKHDEISTLISHKIVDESNPNEIFGNTLSDHLINSQCVSVRKKVNESCFKSEKSLGKSNVNEISSKTLLGFQTGSGKNIEVSEKSLKAFEMILEECGTPEQNLGHFVPIHSPVDLNYSNPKHKNFLSKNLSGQNEVCFKKIEVSEASIEKAQKIFIECNIQDENAPLSLNNTSDSCKTVNSEYVNELTKGKTESLCSRTDKILDTDYIRNCILPNEDHSNHIKNISMEHANLSLTRSLIKDRLSNPVSQTLGFKTANNRAVEIREVSLLTAKRLWENTDENELCHTKHSYPYIEVDKLKCNNLSSRDSKYINVSNSKSENYNIEGPISAKEHRSVSPVFGSCRVKRFNRNQGPKKLTSFKFSNCTQTKISESKECSINFSMEPICLSEKNNVLTERKCNEESEIQKLDNPTFKFATGRGAKQILNQVQPNDVDFIDNRVVPITNTSEEFHQNLSNHISQCDSAHKFATQDFIEISKVSEAFILDANNSWDDLSLTFNQCPSSSLKRHRTKSTADEFVLKKQKLEETLENVDIRSQTSREIQSLTCIIESDKSCDNLHGFLFQLKNNKNYRKYKLSNFNLVQQNFRSFGKPLKNVSATNASNFRFHFNEKAGLTNECYEGFHLIPGSDDKVGVEEIQKSFQSSSLINSTLIHSKWVENHYKWIVWKLASYQQKMDCFSNNPLTLKETLKQLKYRYDIEVVEGRRSVLRKIFEQDDLPQKTMVLCVCEINIDSNNGNNSFSTPSLLLTDGWYSIRAQIDNAMMSILQRKVLKVGFKLIIHGSELVGTPSPCHPLENKELIQIKIHTNMVRIAQWHCKLGLYGRCGPLPSTYISCILDGGGVVGTLDVILARKYPLIYMEKVEGKTVMYNEKAHNINIQDFEIRRESILQEIYSQIAKEKEDEIVDENDMNDLDFIRDLPNGKEILKNITTYNDLSYLESQLSPQQMMLIYSWKQSRSDKTRSSIQSEVQRQFTLKNQSHDSVPMLKLGVVDRKGTSAVITIWRPQEDILQLLTEEKSYRVHFLAATEMRNGLKHLTWNKHSRIQDIKDISSQNEIWKRKVTYIEHVNSLDSTKIPFGEMDVVGIVARINEPNDGKQVAYLVDQKENVLALKFWPTIQTFGFTNVLEVGVFVAVSNASWRGKCDKNYATLHVTTHTTISTAPSKQYLQEAIKDIRDNVENLQNLLNSVNFTIDNITKDEGVNDASLQQCSPKFNRVPKNCDINGENRSKEVDAKIRVLKKLYPVSSPIHSLHTKSSPNISKPFRVPIRSLREEENAK